ncbi:hypothetical protein vseg_014412 [Gypsophila vaccaria]
MTYRESNMINTRTPSQTLGLHKDSRNITKIQPKIRIIHIYAPEIIKTDVANFRDLVQRLTGKQSLAKNQGGQGRKSRGKPKTGKVNHDKSTVNTNLEFVMRATTTTTGSSSSPSSSSDHRQDDQPEFWRPTPVDHPNNASGGGFLSGFTDLENFDLSMFNMNSVDGSSHHINSFGETSQLSFRG